MVLNESSASDVAEGRIVRLALAEGSGDTSDEMGINEVPEGRIVRLALAEGVGEEADEAGVGEVTEGRVVRLALTDGADGQQIIQEVPADQVCTQKYELLSLQYLSETALFKITSKI